MKISIAGAHGSIAMLLHPLLKQNGHTVRGLIRKPEQSAELEEAGAEPVICDLEKEDDISGAVGDADAVIFAAGAGPGSGAERKWKVDRDGAVKLIEAAGKNGIRRYIMISAMGLDEPRGDEIFRVYQQAKAEADEALRNSGLEYVIIKPGRLTDKPGTGKVKAGENLDRDSIPRADVAAVISAIIDAPSVKNITFDLVQGDTPVSDAVNELEKAC